MALQSSDWVLTTEAFEGLLSHLDDDAEHAASAYELLRQKLSRVFRYRGCTSALDLADEVFNRTARKIAQGEQIPQGEITNYLFGVARNVLREYYRRPEPGAISIDDLSPSAQPIEDPQRIAEELAPQRLTEDRLRCLEGCLERHPPETRELVISYYEGQERAKIRNRLEMAQRMGITMNTLRIRMHRTRSQLERCVSECLGREAQ